LRDWYNGIGRQTGDQIGRQINIGLAQGETVDQITRRVRGTRAANYKDGVWATTRRNAESVVRTATNHVSNQARQETYEENQEVVKGWRFVATLDARTTLICASNDGRVWPVGEGEQPPLHFSCRSTTVPVLKSWKELGINLKEAPPGTRASMNGQVPATETYPQWLKKQPASVQNEVLGRAKGELFRRGQVPIERFVDRRNKPLSVAQLESLEKQLAG
jgi:SPP1 gp7 family putative phage head morphogenesis protein